MTTFHRSVSWWVVAVTAAAALTALTLPLGAHTRHEATLSPTDEGAHFDYVVDLEHGHVPVWGDLYTQPTLRLISCLDIDHKARAGCGARERDPRDFAPAGYSYEAQQPPLGYLPFLLVLNANAPPRQAIAHARLGGIVWTSVAAALLVLIGFVEELSLLELVAVLGICLLNPVAMFFTSVVTNDASAIAAGAMALLCASLARRWDRPLALAGLLVGVTLGLMKGIDFVVPLALVVAAMVRHWSGPRTDRSSRSELWRRHACVLLMLAGAMASSIGWVVLQNIRATVPDATVTHALLGGSVTSLPQWATVEASIGSVLSPMAFLTPAANLDLVWELVVMGSLLGAVLVRYRDESLAWVRATAAGCLGGLVVMGVATQVVVYLQGHYNFATPNRYGLPVVPIIALVVVRAWRTRGIVVAGVALPGAVVVTQLFTGRL